MVFAEQPGFDKNKKEPSVVMMLYKQTTDSAATKYLHHSQSSFIKPLLENRK